MLLNARYMRCTEVRQVTYMIPMHTTYALTNPKDVLLTPSNMWERWGVPSLHVTRKENHIQF